MKKTLFLLLTVLFIYTQNSYAQDTGQIRGRAGLALGTASGVNESGEAVGFGITVGGDYFITEQIAAGVSYTYFFKSSYTATGIDLSINASTLDFDGKYYFLNEGVNVYGLFGLSVGFAKATTTIDFGFGPQTVSASDSEFGINIGGGLDYYLSEKMFLNAQVKWNTPLGQLGIDAGVGFNIN